MQPRWRRRWLIGVTAGWAVLVAGLAVFSVYRDRPTVPEQRDVVAAVPVVDRAAGAVVAAVGDRGVTAIGALIIDRECAVTSVRAGAEATRDVTVHVRPGEGPAALDAIAAGLPAAYRAKVSHNRAGTRHVLRADAGEFVAVRGTVDEGGAVLTVRSSTGCRPPGAGVTPTEPPAGQVPPALTAALAALKLSSVDAATVREVGCPGGGVARTVVVGGAPAPDVLQPALEPVTAGAAVVEAEPDRYAYRAGGASIVVTGADGRVRITATSPC